MKTFVKHFAIVLGVQVVFLLLWWLTGLGGVIAYFLYFLPWVFANLFSDAPKQIFAGEGSAYFLLIMAVPAIIYALLLSAISSLLINWLSKND